MGQRLKFPETEDFERNNNKGKNIRSNTNKIIATTLIYVNFENRIINAEDLHTTSKNIKKSKDIREAQVI